MTDTAPFDLSSATGRKAIEAASLTASGPIEGCDTGNGGCGGTHADCYYEAVIAAALAVYGDPKCPTCDGRGQIQHGEDSWETSSSQETCPACNGTGQNPDQLVKLSEVVAFLYGFSKHDRDVPRMDAFGRSEACCEAAVLIERWARERPA